MSEAGEKKLGVRLKPDDIHALSLLRDYVQASAGAGIRVDTSDTIRWAIHTCAAFVQADQRDKGT